MNKIWFDKIKKVVRHEMTNLARKCQQPSVHYRRLNKPIHSLKNAVHGLSTAPPPKKKEKEKNTVVPMTGLTY